MARTSAGRVTGTPDVPESRADVRRRRVVSFEKEGFDRPRLSQHPLQHEEQGDEIPPSNPPVDERFDARAVAHGAELADERGRMRAHHFEQRLDGMQHTRDPSEREARRTDRALDRAEAEAQAEAARNDTAGMGPRAD